MTIEREPIKLRGESSQSPDMTSTAHPSLRELALGDLELELKETRRVLERVTSDKLDWKHHEKSRSFGQLAQHVAELPGFALLIVRQDEIDFAQMRPPRAPITTREKLLETFDDAASKLTSALDSIDDQRLTSHFVTRRGPQVLFDAPRVIVIRRMGISHLIHHRGQLTVFLRELGIPVPGVYGPSADER